MIKKNLLRIISLIKNYDLAYISKKIKLLKRKKIDTIIVGLSYSLFGIKDDLLGSTINLSLPSQDIFYSYLLAKKTIKVNQIRKVIIGLSYYSFYFDLSKSKNEKIRIDNVYYPLLKNSHKYKAENITRKRISRFLKRIIYNKLYILIMSLFAYEKYFNLRNTRENVCGVYEFNKLSYNEKLKVGQKRAGLHNKFLVYENTRIENEKIFDEFIGLLIEKDIEPIIVIFPFTKYYKNTFKNEFKDIFYKYINEVNEHRKIRIVDLYNSNAFSDNDFVDADHLNELGAIKITKILSEILSS